MGRAFFLLLRILYTLWVYVERKGRRIDAHEETFILFPPLLLLHFSV